MHATEVRYGWKWKAAIVRITVGWNVISLILQPGDPHFIKVSKPSALFTKVTFRGWFPAFIGATTKVSGPCITTAIWRCRKLSSQWQRSFHLKAALPLVKRRSYTSFHWPYKINIITPFVKTVPAIRVTELSRKLIYSLYPGIFSSSAAATWYLNCQTRLIVFIENRLHYLV